jgi:DNA polymerase-3 subunit gamma/tau
VEKGENMKKKYLEQAQNCPPEFLIRALTLCNECDLNYTVSKNKRLLVELILIRLAQLTDSKKK